MKLALLALVPLTLCAQDAPASLFRASQATLIASAVLDALSSRGEIEANPVLGRGPFEMRRQGAIVIGSTAGYVLLETVLARKWPRMRAAFTRLNFGIAGLHGAAAVWNWSDKQGAR